MTHTLEYARTHARSHAQTHAHSYDRAQRLRLALCSSIKCQCRQDGMHQECCHHQLGHTARLRLYLARQRQPFLVLLHLRSCAAPLIYSVCRGGSGLRIASYYYLHRFVDRYCTAILFWFCCTPALPLRFSTADGAVVGTD
jgi:hypothetical protein